MAVILRLAAPSLATRRPAMVRRARRRLVMPRHRPLTADRRPATHLRPATARRPPVTVPRQRRLLTVRLLGPLPPRLPRLPLPPPRAARAATRPITRRLASPLSADPRCP